LYDFAKGLDQPFLTTEEQEMLKDLNVYAEGGEVANEDAVDMVTRRPGEYGRSYFTPGQFVPTGTALGGAALDPNAIQIPQYTYQRELLPQFGGPPAGTTTQTTMPAGTNVYTPPTLSDTLGQEDIANLLSNITGIFGGGAGTTPAETTPAETTPAETTPAETTPAETTPAETTPAETTPAATTPAATTPAATTPVVEDEYKLDIAGDIGEIATTSVTPYGAIPVDQDYTQEEKDIVAQAIASGEATIPQVAGRFGVTTGDVIEELLRGGYQTPEQVVESLGYTGGVPGLIVELAAQGRTTPEEIVGYFGNNPEYPEYQGITTEDVSDYLRRAGVPGYAGGGMMQGRGYYLGGPTDGMADQIPATINNIEPARLSDGEFVIPADVVSHLGNGNSEAGAQQLYSMMDRVRTERTGTTKQGPEINPTKMMPA
jgi:cell division septation protein DedD